LAAGCYTKNLEIAQTKNDLLQRAAVNWLHPLSLLACVPMQELTTDLALHWPSVTAFVREMSSSPELFLECGSIYLFSCTYHSQNECREWCLLSYVIFLTLTIVEDLGTLMLEMS